MSAGNWVALLVGVVILFFLIRAAIKDHRRNRGE